MNEGWIKLFRKFRDWEWYQDGNTVRVFLEILLTANIEDKRWQGIEVKRGQLVTSIQGLLIALNKKPKHPEISTQNIRTALTKLKSTKELTIQTTSTYTLITINKYNDYQGLTKVLTNDQQTTNKRLTTTKEYKKKRIHTVEPATISDQQKQIISFWVKTLGGKYLGSAELDKNISYWINKGLTLQDILTAVGNIPKLIEQETQGDFWHNMSPQLFFRQRNKQGEADYIFKALNAKGQKMSSSDYLLKQIGL